MSHCLEMQPIHNLDPKAKWGAPTWLASHTHTHPTPKLLTWWACLRAKLSLRSCFAAQQPLPSSVVSLSEGKHPFQSFSTAAIGLAEKVPFLSPDKQHMNSATPYFLQLSQNYWEWYTTSHHMHTHMRGGGLGLRRWYTHDHHSSHIKQQTQKVIFRRKKRSKDYLFPTKSMAQMWQGSSVDNAVIRKIYSSDGRDTGDCLLKQWTAASLA